MKNILLLNGAKNLEHSGDKLNDILYEVAKEGLLNLGLKVDKTHINKGYDIENEVVKILNVDAIIYQMPGRWMGEPWIVKKYIDEVFATGHGKFYANDGRSREDASKKYGSSGLVNNKKYMFSLTWNAPLEIFNDKEQFFEGVGVDGVYLHLHKASQFLGMKPLPAFICNDVMKNPQVEKYIEDYKMHSQKVFS